MNAIQIIKRGRGEVLLESGWQYYKHVIYKNRTSLWRCKQFKTNVKCAGAVTLNTVSYNIYVQSFLLISLKGVYFIKGIC